MVCGVVVQVYSCVESRTLLVRQNLIVKNSDTGVL